MRATHLHLLFFLNYVFDIKWAKNNISYSYFFVAMVRFYVKTLQAENGAFYATISYPINDASRFFDLSYFLVISNILVT